MAAGELVWLAAVQGRTRSRQRTLSPPCRLCAQSGGLGARVQTSIAPQLPRGGARRMQPDVVEFLDEGVGLEFSSKTAYGSGSIPEPPRHNCRFSPATSRPRGATRMPRQAAAAAVFSTNGSTRTLMQPPPHLDAVEKAAFLDIVLTPPRAISFRPTRPWSPAMPRPSCKSDWQRTSSVLTAMSATARRPRGSRSGRKANARSRRWRECSA